jgi:hypothetical protein
MYTLCTESLPERTYMLCIKLGSVIRIREMLEDIVTNHAFEDGMDYPITGESEANAFF